MLQVLGVSEMATNDEIARCYKRLCLLLHPDKIGADPTCAKAFLKVGRAKQMLFDASCREQHTLALQMMQHADRDGAGWLAHVHAWMRRTWRPTTR